MRINNKTVEVELQLVQLEVVLGKISSFGSGKIWFSLPLFDCFGKLCLIVLGSNTGKSPTLLNCALSIFPFRCTLKRKRGEREGKSAHTAHSRDCSNGDDTL